MNNIQSQLNTSFRFLMLNRMQSFTLKKELLGAYCIEVEDKTQYIGVVPLNEATFNDIIDFYIKQQLTLDDCDISITVNIKQVNIHQQVPTIVSDMLKHIECAMSVIVSQD